MRTAILLFPGVTALDAIGPFQTLCDLPGHEVVFVGQHAGPVGNGSNFMMEAQVGIDEVPQVDVLVVPGGLSAITMARSGHALIDWIAQVHPTTRFTTSVCTGGLMLGAAGVLRGVPATTHWYSHAELARYGAIPTDQRVVEHGKIITAAGVSAGIDMGLTLVARLAGDDFARQVQLDIEYDPAPPFQAGHPRSAPPAITARLRAMYDEVLAPS